MCRSSSTGQAPRPVGPPATVPTRSAWVEGPDPPMCIGIPMEILSSDGHRAMARTPAGTVREIRLLLVGAVAVGSHVLVISDTAMREIDSDEARKIADALEATTAAAEGQPFEHLFADLIGREPQLPPGLEVGGPNSAAPVKSEG